MREFHEIKEEFHRYKTHHIYLISNFDNCAIKLCIEAGLTTSNVLKFSKRTLFVGRME